MVRYAVVLSLLAVLCWFSGCGGGGSVDASGDGVVTESGAMAFTFTWPSDGSLDRLRVMVQDAQAPLVLEVTRAGSPGTVEVRFPTVAAGPRPFLVEGFAGSAATLSAQGQAWVYAQRTTTTALAEGTTPVKLVVAVREAVYTVGATCRPSVMALDAQGALVLLPPGRVSLISETPEIARVNADGTVTLLQSGTARLLAQATFEVDDRQGVALGVIARTPGMPGKLAFSLTRFDPTSCDTPNDFCCTTGLYVATADGASVYHIPGTNRDDYGPQLTPDGKRVLFVSRRNAQQSWERNVYVMNLNGSGLRQLTTTSIDDYQLTDNGQRIIYWWQGLAYSVRLDGSGFQQVRFPAVGLPMRHVVYSPDGSMLAFVTPAAPGTVDLYTVKADGSSLRLVTRGIVDDPSIEREVGALAISPDNQHIAYVVGRLGITGEVYLIDADGRNAHTLANPGQGRPDVLSFSPDSRYLAFSQSLNGGGPVFDCGDYSVLYLVNTDGSGIIEYFQGAVGASWSY